MIRSRIRRLAIGRGTVVAAGLMLLLASGANAATSTINADGSTTISDGGYSFINYQLGGLPAEYCPDVNSPCQNHAAEPAIRADKFGNFFGSSENGLTSGTEAWKSIDGGRHYVHLPSPNQVSSPAPGAGESNISPAGGDTDLATATAKNAFGIYNVYVASLTGASTDVGTSQDGGHTWSQNLLSGIFPGEDREWIAADGSQKVCISYLSAAGVLIAPAGLHVQCSYNAGTTFTQIGDAVEATNLDARSGMKTGNLAIDQNSNTTDPARNNDILYQIFVSGTVQDQANPNPTDFHIVWMGVSLDGGKTFKDYQVYNNPNPAVGYAHNFPNVSVDQAGNVYAFFSDNHYVYYKYSTDHGQTWLGGSNGAPIAISKAPANTAIFPWSSAGTAGKVDLVYYGTSYYDGVNPPDSYPASANWYVYFAQNLNVLNNTSGWTQVQASPINHRGAVCEGGVGCTGNRDLYDDFGVAASPTTGLASIIYSDDQYAQFNHTLTYSSNCTAASDNTASCDHTSIATQVAGTTIFGGTSSGGSGTGGSGCREADGGGDMAGATSGTAHASFDGDSCKDGDTDNVQAHDSGSGEDFQSTRVDSIQFDDVADSVTMVGTGLSNGKTVAFEMVAVNNGTLPATIFLTLDDGYTLSGPLLNGTVILN